MWVMKSGSEKMINKNNPNYKKNLKRVKMTIRAAEIELNKIDKLYENGKISKLQHDKKSHIVLKKLVGKK